MLSQVGSISSRSTITNGTCSVPQAGTSGTVSCTMRFGPATASSIITIHVEAAQTGTFVNTVQTSTGQQASASTTVTDPPPPPPGSFQVTKTGPATVIMHEGQRSEKFPYTITIKYVGPPRTSFDQHTFRGPDADRSYRRQLCEHGQHEPQQLRIRERSDAAGRRAWGAHTPLRHLDRSDEDGELPGGLRALPDTSRRADERVRACERRQRELHD